MSQCCTNRAFDLCSLFLHCRYLLALRHKSLPSVPDVLPILSGSTELAGVCEVQFYVDQDTVYVVDEKIEVRAPGSIEPFLFCHTFIQEPYGLHFAKYITKLTEATAMLSKPAGPTRRIGTR